MMTPHLSQSEKCFQGPLGEFQGGRGAKDRRRHYATAVHDQGVEASIGGTFQASYLSNVALKVH